MAPASDRWDGLAAGVLEDQGYGAVETLGRHLGVNAALEAVAGVGGDAQRAAGGGDAERVPEGGFDQDVHRGVGDTGGLAAHDAGEGLRAGVVGDDHVPGRSA
jgi:hypothetical protein